MTWTIVQEVIAQFDRAQEQVRAAFQGRPELRPVAAFTALGSATDPLGIELFDGSYDPKGGTIVSWDWNFGDASGSTYQNPTHSYQTWGSYLVTLIVTDNSGLYGQSQAVQRFAQPIDPTPDPTPPIAKFSSTPSGLTVVFADLSTDSDGSVTAWVWAFGEGPTASFTRSISGRQVTFTDTSSDVAPGTITLRSWNFGDSTTSTVTNPVKTYGANGTYSVTLAVTDDENNTDSYSTQVTVSSGTVAIGRPYGPTEYWTSNTRPSVASGYFNTGCEYITAPAIAARLAAMKAAGYKEISQNPGGSHNNYISNGSFDLNKWKAAMDTYREPTANAAIKAAVADGTYLGNIMIDEPHHFSWGGNITKATLDEMADYARAIYGAACPQGVFMGGKPDWRSTEHYRSVDFVAASYWSQQTKDQFLVLCQNLAAADGVKILHCVNVLDGGGHGASCSCGSGTFSNFCRMCASQVQTDSLFFAPHGVGLIYWRFDTTMFSNAAYQSAFSVIKASLATQPTVLDWRRA